LRRKKSNTIGVVIPEVADSFFSNAIKGIETVAREKGYHVLVYLTYESFEREKAILKDFASGRVDGILISISTETPDTTHLDEMIGRKIPLVFFDRVLEGMNTVKIITNDFESIYNATNHLIEKGCRKIIYLSISKHLNINSKRMEGYKKALQDHHIWRILIKMLLSVQMIKMKIIFCLKRSCPERIIPKVSLHPLKS
jgi:LacI family transcriptional regulator